MQAAPSGGSVLIRLSIFFYRCLGLLCSYVIVVSGGGDPQPGGADWDTAGPRGECGSRGERGGITQVDGGSRSTEEGEINC